MSLDANRLANAIKADLPAAIKAAMDSTYPPDPDWDANTLALVNTDRLAFATMISNGLADVVAEKVVAEIVTNAAVSVTSVSGVTAGVDTSGSGTGTIS